MRVLIVPDVHGRNFWKSVINEVDRVDRIVFLGDYTDHYPHEGDKTTDQVLSNFQEILDFKRSNPDKVVLLIGNHDYQYLHDIYWCRFSKHYRETFLNNKDLLQISYQIGKYLFTHAMIDRMFRINFLDSYPDDMNWSDRLTKLYKDDPEVYTMVSGYRGGWDRISSPIWMDIRESPYDRDYLEDGTVQIFGHTLMNSPVIMEFINCLDCCKVFELNTDSGEIKEFTNQ